MSAAAPLDTLLRVEAPEGIFLELSPAGLTARALAFLIDLMVRFVLMFIASMGLGWAGGMGYGAFLIVLFLIEWFYPVLFELGLQGATPGKRALGLKVVMDSGLPVTPAASVVRNLLRTVDFLPFFYAGGVLCMLLRPDFKRLGDLAAGTLVVYDRAARERTGKAAMTLPSAAPVAPECALSAAQQAVLMDLAARAPRLTAERVEELAQLARAALPVDREQPATPALLSAAQWLYGRR